MKREKYHKVQGMWMLLLRTCEITRRREVWFIVNGTWWYSVRESTFQGGRINKVNKGAKNVLEFFQRAVDDLEFCRTFPWGRFSYDYMLKEISHTIDHFGGLLLAFEAIPKLGKRYREPVEGADIKCPRMCRWAFKPIGMRGMPLSDIYDEMSNDTDIDNIIPTKTAEENCLLDDIFEEDDDVDESDIAVESWEKRLGEGYRVFFKDMFEEDLAAEKRGRTDRRGRTSSSTTDRSKRSF
ncbi:hypothetical protein Bca52824_010636 [Brassica carinata]|uniref:DUF287 domain-containing protein n=1 Tax=Brassica carinata TaxID=52824 RepID=A0A8X8BB16_BRACI|nr:hypothetical protein Bca52824_010636 [Brassica carinata]